jgi:L-fucono-1,5-lactonase
LRIDSHQHFTPEYSPRLLQPILKRNRFDATVMVGSVELVPCASEQFVLAFVIETDLADPVFPKLLDDLQRHPKFRGAALTTGCYPFDVDPLPAGLSELARRDLTLDLPPRPELVPAIAERFPGLRLALDHIGRPSLMTRPFDEWARDLEIAAQHPLLAAKISGLISDAPTRWHADQFRPAVRHALRTLGPDRVMYGSDWPCYLPEGTWKEALAAFTQSVGALPVPVREHLLGLTAARFYRIDAGAAA